MMTGAWELGHDDRTLCGAMMREQKWQAYGRQVRMAMMTGAWELGHDDRTLCGATQPVLGSTLGREG